MSIEDKIDQFITKRRLNFKLQIVDSAFKSLATSQTQVNYAAATIPTDVFENLVDGLIEADKTKIDCALDKLSPIQGVVASHYILEQLIELVKAKK